MKVTFWYVRHGQTLFNQAGRMQGHCDSPLTEEGREGAQETASALRKVHFDDVYSSSSGRAWETAGILSAPHHMEVKLSKALKEFDFGDLDGQLFQDMQERIQSHRISDDWTDVHGENVELFAKRTTPFFEQVAENHPDGSHILIVSHGSFFMHLMKTLLHVDQQEYIHRMNRLGRQWVPNCSISVFQYEDGNWSLLEEPQTAEEYRQKHDHKIVHFWFMRHGETVFNVQERIQGWCDSPLTEKGKEQAVQAGSVLKKVPFAHVLCSDLERTRDTAALVSDFPAEYDERLREVFYGSLEGEPYGPILDQIRDRHVNVHYGELGGEERKDVEKRIRSLLRDASDSAGNGDNILLVSHGDTYFTLMETLFDIPRSRLYEEALEKHVNPVPNCGIARFDYETGKGFTLIHKMKPAQEIQQ